MRDRKLDRVLDEYDADEIEVVATHDGFTIYEIAGQKLWSWDLEFDREPMDTLETLFERLGYEVKTL